MKKTTNIKGAIFEFFIRSIFLKAGFCNVKPTKNDYYIFENKGLLFVNGKGAAHDADILLTPPIQLPLTYPTRLLIECKAYKEKVGLPIVRNLCALREDLNSFDFTTKETLESRKKNKNSDIVESSNYRYLYQTGMACAYDYTIPAIDYARRNKLQLFSLSSLIKGIGNTDEIARMFELANEELISNVEVDKLNGIFKDRKIGYREKENEIIELIDSNSNLKNLYFSYMGFINRSKLGILSSGEYIFLFELYSDENYFKAEKFTYKGEIVNTVTGNNWVINLEDYPNMQIHFHLQKESIESWFTNELEEPRIVIYDNPKESEIPIYEIKITKTNNEYRSLAR